MTGLQEIIYTFHNSVLHLISEVESWVSNYDNGYIIGTTSDDDLCAMWYTLTTLTYLTGVEYTTIEEISKIRHALEEIERVRGSGCGGV